MDRFQAVRLQFSDGQLTFNEAMATSITALHSPVEQLSLAELIDLTRSVADDVAAGLYAVHSDEHERWHIRLFRDSTVDIWLISWTTDQGTQFHDHGGSAGAFTVVAGQLSEASVAQGSGRAVEQQRQTGESVAFGPRYVHDVRNVETQTAISVHAYSPPLQQMNFYDLDDTGTLIKLAHIWTDDPEEPAPASITATVAKAS